MYQGEGKYRGGSGGGEGVYTDWYTEKKRKEIESEITSQHSNFDLVGNVERRRYTFLNRIRDEIYINPYCTTTKL